MNDFTFSRKNEVLLDLTICGSPYTFNVSPTNYGFIKRIAELSREVEKILTEFNSKKKDSIFDIEKAFDFLKDKEKEVIEILLPGKWDELFTLAGQDLMEMVELITFISEKVKASGSAAKKDAVIPELPEGAPEV